MCAVCRFADVPALWHVSRLTQHAPVARVHVTCVAVPSVPSCLLGLLEKYLSHRCFIMNAVSDVAAA